MEGNIIERKMLVSTIEREMLEKYIKPSHWWPSKLNMKQYIFVLRTERDASGMLFARTPNEIEAR